MGRSSKGFKIVSGALLALVVFVAIVLWRESGATIKVVEPSDQELAATFHAHRRAFEQLQKMAAEDARRNWYLGASDPGKIGKSRRDEYKKLISEIRPELQVGMNGTTGVVRFIFAGEGVAIGPGWVKGIEFVPDGSSGEGVRLPDLDKAASLPARVYIREIEPRWLIFYQRDE